MLAMSFLHVYLSLSGPEMGPMDQIKYFKEK